MPVTRHEVGSSIYLFENTAGGDTCLITAHGGFIRNSNTFRPSEIGGSVELFFYTPHGTSLADPGINYLYKTPQPVDEYRGDDLVNNYLLSKYQGRHSGFSKTYQTIEQKVQADQDSWDALQEEEQAGGDLDYIRHVRSAIRPSHVVTIRNRRQYFGPLQPHLRPVSLKEVIVSVRAYMVRIGRPAITKFHCSFCRSRQFFGGSEAGAARPAPTLPLVAAANTD